MKNSSTWFAIQLLFIFLVLGMGACQSEPESSSAPDISTKIQETKSNKGKELFITNCASCHHPIKDAMGPALKGAVSRAPNTEWIYKFVHNSAKLISEGDPYANKLYENWNKTMMTNFPALSNEDIDAIMKYCDSEGYKVVP